MLYSVQSTNTLDLQIKLVPFVSGISYHKFEVSVTKGCNIMKKEIWKVYPKMDWVMVSNFGRIKTLAVNVKTKLGSRNYKALIRKISKSHAISDKTAYGVVNLHSKTYHVHRLVAETFIPNHLNKKCVNHIDGDGMNNNVDNLEWCTYKENNQHASKVLRRMGKIINGKNMTEHAYSLGAKCHSIVADRIKKGWCEECAFSVKVGGTCKHKVKKSYQKKKK